MKFINSIIKRIRGIRKGDQLTYEGVTFTHNGKYWAITDIGYITIHPYRKQSIN
jgi:hypothetical protein